MMVKTLMTHNVVYEGKTVLNYDIEAKVFEPTILHVILMQEVSGLSLYLQVTENILPATALWFHSQEDREEAVELAVRAHMAVERFVSQVRKDLNVECVETVDGEDDTSIVRVALCLKVLERFVPNTLGALIAEENPPEEEA